VQNQLKYIDQSPKNVCSRALSIGQLAWVNSHTCQWCLT